MNTQTNLPNLPSNMIVSSNRQPHLGEKGKNEISNEDWDKIDLSKFDESDPKQHQMKLLWGLGKTYGL